MSPRYESKDVENPYAAPLFSSPESQLIVSPDSEAEELTAFVGAKADYYLKKWTPLLGGRTGGAGFNWAAFLLSGLWLPYRKMYRIAAVLYGFILFESLAEEVLFIGVLGNPETPAILGHIVGLAVSVICGTYANSWYLAHARKVISNIKIQDMEREVQLQVISNRGGTSFGSSLGWFLLFLFVMFAIFIALEFMRYPG